MIRLKENKSQIWFKVFGPNHLTLDGSVEQWDFPTVHTKGAKTRFQGVCKVLSCSGAWQDHSTLREATWLVKDPSKLYIPNSDYHIYVVQIWDTPILETPGMIWVCQASLLRKATDLDLKRYGIYRSFSHHL